MKHFECTDANAQIRGDALVTFLESFPEDTSKEKARSLLESHGIPTPNAGDWYPLQAYLDVMKDIHETLSDQVLLITGRNIGLKSRLSGEMDHLDYFVRHLDEYYHTNHRGEVGHFSFSDLADNGAMKRLEVVSTTPYGCSFEMGLLEGFADHFKQSVAKDVLIKQGEDTPCRKRGEDSCTYVVEWF